jgi:hypothetical protein
MLVSSNLQGVSVALVVTRIAHLLGFYRSHYPHRMSELLPPWWWGRPRRALRALSPHSSWPALGLSCRCPPGMRMVLVIYLHRSLFSCYYSNLKKWCHGDRSRASSVSVCGSPMIPLHLPLMASSITSVGDLAEVALDSQRPVVAPVPRMLSASGTTQDAADLGLVGSSPQLGDDARSSLRDLVMRGTGAGVPRSVVPGDAPQPPGPQVPRVREYLDFTCRALSTFRPRQLTRGC